MHIITNSTILHLYISTILFVMTFPLRSCPSSPMRGSRSPRKAYLASPTCSFSFHLLLLISLVYLLYGKKSKCCTPPNQSFSADYCFLSLHLAAVPHRFFTPRSRYLLRSTTTFTNNSLDFTRLLAQWLE